MLELDHLAVSAMALDEGVSVVEAALGVSLSKGGEHPLMGTHNYLLGLGDIYLEVIAINPNVTGPDHPRWFDLDGFSGSPRITNWICRSDDLREAIDASPEGVGVPVSLERADLRWQMAVPENGRLPFDNTYPALIQWEGRPHPAPRLTDVGCRLRHLEITHPDAFALNASLNTRLTDPRVTIGTGSSATFRAEIDTPHGIRVLE